MWRAGVTLFLCTGCVVGAPHRPSRLELARAPSDPPPPDATALTGHPGCRAPAEEPPPAPPAEGAVWIAGQCHSTSVQYEWVPGHYELRDAPYSWK